MLSPNMTKRILLDDSPACFRSGRIDKIPIMTKPGDWVVRIFMIPFSVPASCCMILRLEVGCNNASFDRDVISKVHTEHRAVSEHNDSVYHCTYIS